MCKAIKQKISEINLEGVAETPDCNCAVAGRRLKMSGNILKQ